MREILPDLTRWLEAGEHIALATVVGVEGTAPRPLGSHMAVTGSGCMAGSVSNGCAEGAVFEQARDVLAGGAPKRLGFDAVEEEGLDVGLACGGAIEVYVEPFAALHQRLLESLRADEAVAMATGLDGGGHVLAWADGRVAGDRALVSELVVPFPGPAAELQHSSRGDVFVQVFVPAPTLIIVGAVHVAIPLVSLAQTLGFRVRVVDPRRVFATRERFPVADDLVLDWPQDALAAEELGPRHHVVVLSHDPKFDLPALRIALRSRAAYVGLLGSVSTQDRRLAALRDEGFDEADLARIHGPVGLDLGGREAAEIALAILAEIVAERYGRCGGKLSAREESG
jgi:xanthine dehydrogenase accessory factor